MEFDSSSMNFDNWYAATTLSGEKKKQAAEPRSERVTAGEARRSRAPTRNGSIYHSVMAALQFVIQTCGGKSLSFFFFCFQ